VIWRFALGSPNQHNPDMEILCSQCEAPMSCEPERGCWCADLPKILPVPRSKTAGCLCRDCLSKRLSLQVISPTLSRLEGYFPLLTGGRTSVLLVNPAQNSVVPPLDLLKISTFLRKRGYTPRLHSGQFDTKSPVPHAVVFTTVFSWDIPPLRKSIALVHRFWPRTKTILMGVLPRKFGDKVQQEFGVWTLDERSEVLLDDESPDYALVPEWDASILITSKGVCPRECSHCETAAQGKGVTRLITKWRSQLNLKLSRVEVWDNTLMLTPREHFLGVAKRIKEIDKPVDFVCGLTPGGVEETELRWRIGQLAEVHLLPARLECNRVDDFPRFCRLLSYSRSVLGNKTRYRSFAVVNGTEDPLSATERIRRMEAEGVEVDVVCFTPHDWEGPQPYVNRSAGWTSADIESFTQTAASGI
jgi:hypothetical protein